MGIFDRLSTLIKSNINDLISSAEDPEKMLSQIIVDMRNQLAKAKQQVAAAIADEKRLRDQADNEFKVAEDWEKRAMLAVQQGRDDLATQALLRQQEHMEHAQQLAVTWEAHKVETEKLKQSLRDLNDKIEEAKRKKNLLVARQRRAEAQQRIATTLSGLSEKSAFEAFNRMEERITANERKLLASQEIDEEFTGDRLTHEFKQLERSAGGASADRQLAALKQRMGLLGAGEAEPKKQLGAGEAAPAEADAEVDAEPAAQPSGLDGAAGTPAPSKPSAEQQTTEAELIAEIEGLEGGGPRS
jgi:phage shock protein A